MMRPGSMVVIKSPVGSRYDGRIGSVVRILDGGTVLVRLVSDSRPLNESVILPFGRGEVQSAF